MIQFKRSTGFRTSTPRTSAPTGAPYAALGFIARTSDGQLLRNYTPAIVARVKRRVPVLAHA